MSRERTLVAGLDLGSTKTCAVIAEVVGDLPRTPVAKILGVGFAKNSGVRRGVVRDIDETTRSVQAAMRDAERMAGVEVSGVPGGIGGGHAGGAAWCATSTRPPARCRRPCATPNAWRA